MFAQDLEGVEVLVLDNGSADGTYEAVSELARTAPVPLRVERVPGTVGHVRNVGTRLVRTEFVAFTDSDCVPEPSWLREAIAPLRADPGIAVVCGRTLPEGPPELGWPATIQVDEMTWRFESCNAVYRRDALLACGGFDETGFGWEDAAAGWGVLRGGGRAVFADSAVVRHDVTYPGFAWHLRRVQQHRFAAVVVRRFPESRRALLFARLFIDDRHALLYLAAAGVLLAPRRPAALALALPYAARRRPHNGDYKAAVQSVLLDLARAFAALRGAVSERTLVL